MDSNRNVFKKHRGCHNGEHNKMLCVPPNPNTVPHPGGLGVALLKQMKRNENRIAQIDALSGNKETYGEILSRCIRIAQNLKMHGLKQGDVVTFCTFNNLDCYPTSIASLFVGAIVSALDPILSLEDTIHLLKILEPKIIYCDQAGLELIEKALQKTKIAAQIIFYGRTDQHIPLEKLLSDIDNENDFIATKANDVYDTALIFFTSGTTGISKCIALSHYAMLYVAMQDADCVVNFWISRICWVSTTALLVKSVLSGSSWIMCTEPNPEEFLIIMENYKVNIISLSPYFTCKLIESATLKITHLENLKAILSVGGKITMRQILTLKKLFPNTTVFNAYGLTEMITAFTFFSAKDIVFTTLKPTSCGRAIKGMCYKIVDPETNEIVGPNTPGEIRFKSVFRMNGYYKNPEANALSFDEDGYFRSGDIMYYDEDYCFFYVDRIKDMMKFRSFYVTPSELESILLGHSAVAEAVVVSTPNEKDGDHPTGIVVLRKGREVSAEELRKFVDDQVVDYKQLRGGVKIVDEIPKTATSKLRRRDLREMILNGKI